MRHLLRLTGFLLVHLPIRLTMLMPKELKSDVQVLNLFAQVQDFAEAYALAKEHIGVKMIEDDSASDSE